MVNNELQGAQSQASNSAAAEVDVVPEITPEQVPSALARRPLNDAALSVVPWWTPPIAPWVAIKAPNASLRMAGIVSDRLFDGLRFEGQLQLLTPNNWTGVLAHGRPELLIIESSWDSVTGHWYMAQNAPGASSDELRVLVRAFREAGVPTVYWITEDHAYHTHYREFASHFEHVFCADPRQVELLRAEGLEAQILLPCVQPALYNPFRLHDQYDALELGVLFDGWGELDRHPDRYGVLAELKRESRLSIIESRYLLTHNRLKAAGEHQDNILGCTTREGRQTALKYAKASISFSYSLSSPTTQCWEALQATASYCPGLHFGALPAGDIRHGLIQAFDQDLDALVELLRMEEDDLYRQRIAHLAWRATLQQHTFSHRVRQICHTLGLEHDWEEFPKASVITPTCRPDMVPRAITTYRQQSYPNRELILVYNGPQPDTLPEAASAADITVAHVPGDRFAGAALNLGAQYATGSYCFRMDDDDIYSDNYLLDMVLHQRSFSFGFFGKPPVPVQFEGEDDIRLFLRGGIRRFSVYSKGELDAEKFWLGGNTIGFLRDGSFSYRGNSISAADTFFQHESSFSSCVGVFDNFNACAVRRIDQSSHTWRDFLPEVQEALCQDIYREDLFL